MKYRNSNRGRRRFEENSQAEDGKVYVDSFAHQREMTHKWAQREAVGTMRRSNHLSAGDRSMLLRRPLCSLYVPIALMIIIAGQDVALSSTVEAALASDNPSSAETIYVKIGKSIGAVASQSNFIGLSEPSLFYFHRRERQREAL